MKMVGYIREILEESIVKVKYSFLDLYAQCYYTYILFAICC